MLLAGGGTGGHVYPGLAVAAALRALAAERGEALEMLYVGVRGRIDETIVPRHGIEFRTVSAGPLRVASPLTFVRNATRLALGTVQSLRILRGFRPDAVFATGGYASVPVGVAARLLRTPLVVYLPDVTPGWAVRLLSRLATRMATTSEGGLAYLPASKTVVVGYPVRDGFWRIDRAAARARLSLPADEKVVLVTGASLGAQTINEAVTRALPRLLDRAIVLHLTGSAHEALALEERAKLPPEQARRYLLRGYLDDMPAAMAAADLVISRSGASVLGELPAAGAPAILIPGEYEGWSQAPNAEHLEAQGAAVMLRNADLARLADTVVALLDDGPRLARMRAAMSALARPSAAHEIASMLMEAAA